MSKTITHHLLQNSLGNYTQAVGEPPSLHHDGATSIMTAQPKNVLTWFYDQAPSLYMHSRYAIAINVKSSCSVGIDTNTFVLQPDEGVLIFPFQSHYLTPPASGKYLNMAITFALQNPLDRSLEPLRDSVFKVSANDTDNLKEIIRISRSGKDDKIEIPHILSRFLCKKLHEVLVTPKIHPTTNLRASKYDQIVNYIRNHISEPISIKDIANSENISIPHIRRLFKEKTGGLTVGRFILTLRIKRAYEMLMHTDMNVAEIAEKCGFSDQFVFSRAFKRMAGQSPINYRKQQRR